MTTGQHIKKRREELNISQTELANRVKISKQTLYKYEHDIVTNIPYDTIIALSDALDCSGAFLLGWMDNSQYDSEYIKNATDLYNQIMSAPPEIQAAISTLLKSQQCDS